MPFFDYHNTFCLKVYFVWKQNSHSRSLLVIPSSLSPFPDCHNSLSCGFSCHSSFWFGLQASLFRVAINWAGWGGELGLGSVRRYTRMLHGSVRLAVPESLGALTGGQWAAQRCHGAWAAGREQSLRRRGRGPEGPAFIRSRSSFPRLCTVTS